MTDVVATVVATRKSSPRPVGSKLIVTEDGRLEGSVSGGCVESDVFEAAQQVMETGTPRLLTYGITDDMAFNVGLPCGGELDELATDALRRGRSHTIVQDDRTIFADIFGPPPTLFVYGAVDTAEALCKAAKLLGWHTVVADARARFATKERIPSADELLVEWPDDALAHQRPDTAT